MLNKVALGLGIFAVTASFGVLYQAGAMAEKVYALERQSLTVAAMNDRLVRLEANIIYITQAVTDIKGTLRVGAGK